MALVLMAITQTSHHTNTGPTERHWHRRRNSRARFLTFMRRLVVVGPTGADPSSSTTVARHSFNAAGSTPKPVPAPSPSTRLSKKSMCRETNGHTTRRPPAAAAAVAQRARASDAVRLPPGAPETGAYGVCVATAATMAQYGVA